MVNGDCNLISVRRTTYEPLLTVYPQFPPPYPFQIPPQYRESRSARSMATRGPSSWTPLKRQNNSPNGSYSPPSSWYVCGRADASTLSSFLLVSLSIQFNSIQKERDISKYHSRNRKCGSVSKKGLSISKSKSTSTYDQSPPLTTLTFSNTYSITSTRIPLDTQV